MAPSPESKPIPLSESYKDLRSEQLQIRIDRAKKLLEPKPPGANIPTIPVVGEPLVLKVDEIPPARVRLAPGETPMGRPQIENTPDEGVLNPTTIALHLDTPEAEGKRQKLASLFNDLREAPKTNEVREQIAEVLGYNLPEHESDYEAITSHLINNPAALEVFISSDPDLAKRLFGASGRMAQLVERIEESNKKTAYDPKPRQSIMAELLLFINNSSQLTPDEQRLEISTAQTRQETATAFMTLLTSKETVPVEQLATAFDKEYLAFVNNRAVQMLAGKKRMAFFDSLEKQAGIVILDPRKADKVEFVEKASGETKRKLTPEATKAIEETLDMMREAFQKPQPGDEASLSEARKEVLHLQDAVEILLRQNLPSRDFPLRKGINQDEFDPQKFYEDIYENPSQRALFRRMVVRGSDGRWKGNIDRWMSTGAQLHDATITAPLDEADKAKREKLREQAEGAEKALLSSLETGLWSNEVLFIQNNLDLEAQHAANVFFALMNIRMINKIEPGDLINPFIAMYKTLGKADDWTNGMGRERTRFFRDVAKRAGVELIKGKEGYRLRERGPLNLPKPRVPGR